MDAGNDLYRPHVKLTSKYGDIAIRDATGECEAPKERQDCTKISTEQKIGKDIIISRGLPASKLIRVRQGQFSFTEISDIDPLRGRPSRERIYLNRDYGVSTPFFCLERIRFLHEHRPG